MSSCLVLLGSKYLRMDQVKFVEDSLTWSILEYFDFLVIMINIRRQDSLRITYQQAIAWYIEVLVPLIVKDFFFLYDLASLQLTGNKFHLLQKYSNYWF